MRLAVGALLIAAAPLLPIASAAQENPGRAVFEARCASCHALDAAAAPMAGPNLAGLIGRRVAGDATFGYSPVLRRAGQAGQRWDAARLDQFLADPEEMFPGLWMGGNGIANAAERAAAVRFMAGAR
jgi:cytochrome c